ncbi:hypothetical protein [Lactococcus lactis]|uniref:hypothetical protein n=1 Tax=Lactococcus lactis TaxID=1358 RepID=UPI002855400A|nr:hypothetical protein [Lactococcus lactis]MDR7696124.1 hypothetical protein [Lactococcus lactis]
MMKQTRCYGCDKPIEPEWLPEGEFIVCDECSSDTDELSVEKLQEQLHTMKKALAEIVNANDNLFLNVDGRGDLYTALDNARDVLAVIGNEGSGDE